MATMKHTTYEKRLKTGGRLAVVHVPGSPIFQIETYVNSGFRFAKLAQYELPHLLEHLAFEGSARFPDPQVLRYEIEKYGIYTNAFTSFYANAYVLYGAMEYWRHILDLGFEWLLAPTFTEKAIQEQKKVVENELTGKKDNAEGWSGMTLYRQMKNGLVSDWDERIASIQNITRQDIVDFHARYYTPKNLLHIVTGDVPPARVKEIAMAIEAKLAGLSHGKLIPNDDIVPKKPAKVITTTDYPYKDSVRFNLLFCQPGFHQEIVIPLQVMNTILNSGMYSRIYTKSRSAGLSYTVGSSAWGNKESTGVEFYDKVQPQYLEPLLTMILSELSSVAKGEFSDEELERAIGFQVGKNATRFQTALSIADWYETVYTDGMPLKTLEEYTAEIKAVTRQDIINATQSLFDASKLFRYFVISTNGSMSKSLASRIEDFRLLA